MYIGKSNEGTVVYNKQEKRWESWFDGKMRVFAKELSWIKSLMPRRRKVTDLGVNIWNITDKNDPSKVVEVFNFVARLDETGKRKNLASEKKEVRLSRTEIVDEAYKLQKQESRQTQIERVIRGQDRLEGIVQRVKVVETRGEVVIVKMPVRHSLDGYVLEFNRKTGNQCNNHNPYHFWKMDVA